MPFARAPVVLLAACLTLALAGRALAGERVLLEWTAPEGCPAGPEVMAEVDRLLGDKAARPKEPLAVAATVRLESGGGYRVRLETPGASGPRVREIDAASCKTLGDTTALIIAMMIDPAAVSSVSPGGAQSSSSPEDASPSPAQGSGKPADASPALALGSGKPEGASPARAQGSGSPETASPVPVPPDRLGRPPIAIAVRALVARGSLPGTSFGVSATGALYFGRLRIEAGAAIYMPERAIPYPVLPTTGGAFDLALGTAAACWDVRLKRRVYFSPCFDLEIGSLDGKSFGVSSPGEGAALWAAAGAGGRLLAVPWQHFALSFGLDAVLPLHRPTFVVTTLGSFYQPSWAAARLSLGVELRL
jgi:hypothetical protein